MLDRIWATRALVQGGILALLALTLPARGQVGERMRLDDLGGLMIDRTEVTIGQFARHAQATGLRTRAEVDGGGFEYLGGWQRRPGWFWRRPEGVDVAPELPAVHLTQPEAAAYCLWVGGRLPTASEWRRAAFTELRATPPAPWVRGRTYPWPTGDTPQGANTSDPDPWPRAAPVTQTAAGVNGLHDMGANVWEWAADVRGQDRPTLGGSWWYPATQMRADVDAWKPADFPAVYIGFRCVYDPAGPG
jgi:formylglycine-generating enzyme